jgi:hypothetical protein
MFQLSTTIIDGIGRNLESLALVVSILILCHHQTTALFLLHCLRYHPLPLPLPLPFRLLPSLDRRRQHNLLREKEELIGTDKLSIVEGKVRTKLLPQLLRFTASLGGIRPTVL